MAQQQAPHPVLIINPGASPLFAASGQSVRCDQGVVVEIGKDLKPQPRDLVIDANNCALVPGLHDHHIHLLATAAAQASVDCSGKTRTTLIKALRESTSTNSLRAVNYQESIAGSLDRTELDQWIADRPLRIQHSTGQMWFLNSRAIADFGIETQVYQSHIGIERNPDGTATGRLFRADDVLTNRSQVSAPDLTTLSAELASFGVTGVTDTSFNNADQQFELLAAKQHSGELLQHVRLMGSDKLTSHAQGYIHTGELKLLLDEAALPNIDELIATVRRAHADNRSVAMHCVTRIELAVALSVFTATGVLADRIEHASIVPEQTLAQVQQLGLTTVTQPGFIYAKGDRYLTELARSEIPELYRLQSLKDHNIALALSSDAPYGPLNPWQNIQSSVDRKSQTGNSLSTKEALTPEVALTAYCGRAEAPATPRQIQVGSVADLVILNAPWKDLREDLAATKAITSIRAGHLIHGTA